MLYNLLSPLAQDFGPLNLFRYLTFRTGGAVVTALIISFLIGPQLIEWLRHQQKGGQPIRTDGPVDHIIRKKGTPTMGGFLILIALTSSTILWADITSGYVWAVLLVTVGFGAIGAIDDYLKLTRRSSKGLPGRIKLLGEVIVGAAAAIWIMSFASPLLATSLTVPFVKGLLVDLGIFFLPFAVFVMVGTSNAVNLTDGLDEIGRAHV